MDNTIVRRGPKCKYEEGYKAKNKEIKYNLLYYHANKVKICCDRCNKEVNKFKIAEHKRSKYCMKIYNAKINSIELKEN